MSEPMPNMSRPVGAVAYEVDDGIPATIRIVPADPVPETSSDGVPTAMLYVSGTSGMLTLGAQWWPSELELSKLRQQLATALARAPEELVVTPDAFQVTAVRLLLSDNSDGAVIELARSSASGVPPFTALFSADVGPHLAAVQRAFSGQSGLLHVQVEAELTRGRSATTTLSARLDAWAGALLPVEDEGLPAQVDELVARDTIQRTRSATPDSPPASVHAGDDLAAEADRTAAQRFAEAVHRTGATDAGGAGGGVDAGDEIGAGRVSVRTVAVAATVHRPERTTLHRRADVGDWLRASRGRHLLVAAGPADPPAGPSATSAAATEAGRTVRLGFSAEGAPIARLVLSAGGDPVELPSPFDTTVTVPGTGELSLTTSYLTGGPDHRAVLPPGGQGWTLSPAELGLTAVSIDATRLQAAGATAVQVEVFYQPEDRGSPDRRTVQLGDGSWQAGWFVVSRARELAGLLLLTLKVTPNGITGARSTLQSTTPTVQL